MPSPHSVESLLKKQLATGNFTTISPASSQKLSPARSREALALTQTYGPKGLELLRAFNPSAQVVMCRDAAEAHFGSAPALRTVIDAYGYDLAMSWLQIQLNDLSEFTGCRNKLTARQIEQLAEILTAEREYLRLTDFMLFFLRFKQGRYGRFYSSVDPMIITEAFRDFLVDRGAAWQKRIDAGKRAEELRAERELQEQRLRYKRDIPHAFTPQASMTFLEYQRREWGSAPRGK